MPPPEGEPAPDPAPRAEASFRGAGTLARGLVGGAPRRSAAAAGLLLASAVTETFGIALLVPFLYAAGIGAAGANEASPIREAASRAAAALGFELTLPLLLAAFVLLAALRAGVGWQRDVQLAALRLGFVDRLRGRLYGATAEAAWPFLVRRRSSDVLHALTHDANRAGQAGAHLAQAAVTAVLAGTHAVLALFLAPSVAAGLLALGGGLAFAARPLVRRSRALGERLTAAGRTAHAAMSGFLGGLKQAKSDNTEARHVRDYAEALTAIRRDQVAFIRTGAATRALFGVGAAAALAVLAWFGIRHAGLGAPELLVVALLAARVLPAVLRLQQEAQQLAHALPAWRRTLEMEEALRGAAETPAGPAAPPLPLRRALTLRGVTFAWGGPKSGGPAALRDVDLSIPARNLVAVTGPSGAGKSTLVEVLLGLLEPDAGEVRVDGAPLTPALRRRWRRSTAWVPQDPHLFHETLRENLRRGRPEATEADLRRALRLAAADAFVEALPDGLDTVAGDRGARLSGGERQRIVLARALLRRPSLLLLDEPTSQLDPETEARVLETLRSLRSGATVVAVTHQAAVLEAADRVIRLEAGRVAATREPSPPPAWGALPQARAPRGGNGANRPWLSGLVSLFLLAAASPAGAQAAGGDDFRSEATTRLGPLYLKPAFRIERLGMESNVFSEPEPKRDFVASGGPRLDAWLPLGRAAHVATTFIAGFDWYAEYAGERAFNPEVRSRIVLPWRRLTFSAGGAYLRTRRRPDFEIAVRSNRFAEELDGSVALRVLNRLWLHLEARQRNAGFSGDAFLEGTYLSETLNRRERAGVASLRWRPTALTTLVLASEVREVRFGRSPERNSDNLVLTAGADFHPRALISGSGRIGFRRFVARGAAVSDVSRLVAEADLSYRFAGRTAATFRAERDIYYSFERASPYFLLESFGLAITRPVGRRFDLSGRINRDRYRYLTAGRGRDIRWNALGQFAYRLNPRLRAGFEGGYVRAASTTRARRRYRGIVLGLVLDYDI